MLRHALLAVAIIALLIGVGNLTSTNVWLGVVSPVLGLLLGFVWVLWTAHERVSTQQRTLQLSAEDMARLTKVLRDKKAAEEAAKAAQ